MSQPAVDQAKAKLATTTVTPLRTLIENSVAELSKALPEHMSAPRLIRIAQTLLSSNPKLQNCEPRSVLAAIFQCASLGLEPIAGHAYIIPYNIKGQMVAQFQVGYQGWIDLFWRHNAALSIRAESVHEKDHFEYDYGTDTLSHRPPPFGTERGIVVGYYASARMTKGGLIFKVLSAADALAHGQRFSRTWDREKKEFYQDSPWRNHFDEMAKKTVVKQLAKFLPKSFEIQRAMAMDETVKQRVAPEMLEVAPEPIPSEDEPVAFPTDAEIKAS